MRARPSSLPSRVSLLALLAVLGGCGSREPAVPVDAGASTRKARIFMIAVEGGAVSGPRAGCGGRVAPVEVDLPAPAPALRGALDALLDAGDRYERSGLYNALAHSPLRLQRVERRGGAARIFLTGYLELSGACDGDGALAQLTETATQFRDLQRAELFLDGKPLRDLLDGR